MEFSASAALSRTDVNSWGRAAIGVRHTDTLTIDEVAAEIGGAQRNRIARPGTGSPAIVRVLVPERKRRRKERRRRHVQQAVYQSGATGLAVGFAPVREPGHRGADRAREPHTHRERGRATHPRIALGRRVQGQRRRPRAERQIGEDRMERVSKPDAMNRVLGTLPGGAGRLVRSTYSFAQWFCDLIDPWIVNNLHQRCGAFHRVLLTHRLLYCKIEKLRVASLANRYAASAR